RPEGGEDAIVVRNLKTGIETVLHQEEGDIADFSLSPDGRYIAAVSLRLGPTPTVLLLVPAAGGKSRELSRGVGSIATWAPDSASVLTHHGNEFWRVSLEGEARKVGLDLGKMGAKSRNSNSEAPLTRHPISVHPDGHQIAFTVEGDPP